MRKVLLTTMLLTGAIVVGSDQGASAQNLVPAPITSEQGYATPVWWHGYWGHPHWGHHWGWGPRYYWGHPYWRHYYRWGW